MAKMSSIHTLFALVAACQWLLYQMDIKKAFLNGDLSKVFVSSLLLVLLFYLDMYADFDEHSMV